MPNKVKLYKLRKSISFYTCTILTVVLVIAMFAVFLTADNIQNGKITMKMLRQINPDQVQYYANEYAMIEQLIETVNDPSAVLFDPKKVPGSKLKSDILLYRVFGNRTIHVGICQDQDGSWFARSFFVRENDQDQYPSRYLHKMTPLKVKVKVSSKNA